MITTTHAFLFQDHIPEHYWRKVVLTTTYLINQLLPQVLDICNSMEVLTIFFHNIRVTNNLIPRVFGCLSYFHIHQSQKGQLDPKTIRCVFVRCSFTQERYKCYHSTKNSIYLPVLHLLRLNLFLIKLIFKGSLYWKIRMTHFLTFYYPLHYML